MKWKVLFVGLFVAMSFSCKKESVAKKEVEKETVVQENKITVKSYNYSELKPLLEKKDDKIYVINFWATWCGPCVKELPYFEKLGKQYAGKNVEVILVSLDFPKQAEKKLIPFIQKKNLQSEVILLDDVNEDVWIKAIDKNWSGAIPATLIYSKNKRMFYEQSFKYETLEKEVQTFLNP
ncbi:TlpA family protein disulfide reductase [Polaribacter batillariae]|uniref:TlpA family protein disulfide reductase n=1 Tax=Polaribacter batillariae TaxID=2808900 RepID=A0ABX7SV47_9FLAO|nr:TlpA disulfide reductase family protein [Polaribacter batillariae]QTD38110.1 TlpA family protein disulfide reductase [Polaribacter batillariae]